MNKAILIWPKPLCLCPSSDLDPIPGSGPSAWSGKLPDDACLAPGLKNVLKEIESRDIKLFLKDLFDKIIILSFTAYGFKIYMLCRH